MGLISRVSSRTYRQKIPPPRRDDRSPPRRRSDIPPPEELHTVMVAGYHYDTSREELMDYFSKFGEIAEINIPLDYHTRKPRGMAFVRFWKKQSQEDAIQQNKERPFELDGRKLRMEYAYSKPKPGDPRWRRTPPPPRRGGGGGYGRDDRRGGYDRGGYNPRGDDRRGGYDDRRAGYDDRRGGYDDRRRSPPRDDYRRDDRRT